MMKKAAVLSIVFLSVGIAVQAQDTTYNWVSNDGDPQGIDASITLDSPSSVGGSVSDVVSFSVSDAFSGFTSSDLVAPPTSSGAFTWNASQITSMDLTGEAFGNFPFLAGFAFTANEISYEYFDVFDEDEAPTNFSDTGSWQATVPDAESSAVLLGMVLTGLGGLRRVRR
jgi:hypothetical protein